MPSSKLICCGPQRNRQSSLSTLTPFLPLPKYFESEWSYAQYRIPAQSSHISLSSTHKSQHADDPDEERCVVGWIPVPSVASSSEEPQPDWQLVALTFTGGWYRLSLPKTSTSQPSKTPVSKRSRTTSASSSTGSSDKGKEKESHKCVLEEFRRFGRWDGWG
jgi:WD repeat-containing protein 45